MNTSNTEETSIVPDSNVEFFLLKTAQAKKLGKRSEGRIAYQILANIERSEIFLSITGNEGGGYFSKELVPFSQVEVCVEPYTEGSSPFPSKALKSAFTGRSSNNAGFLVCILRNEGLLAAAPDTEMQHIVSGDWSAWSKEMHTTQGQRIERPIPGSDPARPGAEPDSSPSAKSKTIVLKRSK